MSEIIKTRKPIEKIKIVQGRLRNSPFPLIETLATEIFQTRSREGEVSSEGNTYSSDVLFDSEILDDQRFVRVLKEEYDKGYEAGRQSVADTIREEMMQRYEQKYYHEVEQRLQPLIHLLENIQKEWSTIRTQNVDIVVRMSIAIAEQIIKREITLDKAIVVNQIREGLRHVSGVEHVKLRVNPADEAVIREYRPKLMSSSDSIRDMLIEPDDKVQQGGCILESDSGNVDVTLETQLKKIENMFQDERSLMK